MSAEYFLESRFSTSKKPTKIPINQTKYERLKECKRILFAAFAIEEKYELLVSNYNEFETQLLKSSLSSLMNRRGDIYHDGFEERLLFNRGIVNLLSSAKMIFDQAGNHVRICLPDENREELKVKVESLYSMEYDKYFEYRFMSALRNYVQHRGLAVHVVKHGMRRTAQDDSGRVEFSLAILARKTDLDGDKIFKRSVYNEMPSEVNLIYSTRIFLESISKVHLEIREMVKTSVNLARKEIEETLSNYSKVIGEEPTLVEACSSKVSNCEEVVTDRTQIFLEWDDVRLKLIKRNLGLTNLHKRFVTNLVNA